MTGELEVNALAKINLDLRILSKRPDGYHEIRTVFQTISLADTISLRYEAAQDTSIAIGGDMPAGLTVEDNLIARATRLITKELRCGGKFEFRLKKVIPMGAGLGGGSSDAAATLKALPRLIGRLIAPLRLQELAASLGSDIPFFLLGGTAIGLGRGEELHPLPEFPPMQGLLVAPAIHVSTAEAYRALSMVLNPADAAQKRAEFGQFTWTEDLTLARNDFEAPVFQRHPELHAIREVLAGSGAVCARMTGSGSSIFGLFRDGAGIAEAQASLRGHQTFPFSFVSRKQYEGAAR